MAKKQRNPSVPLSETAYLKIKDLIVTLDFAPGDQIDEVQLAEMLSIGRTPIREALFRLVAENLVEMAHGRGFFVRDITLRDIRDLFEAMLIMERSAVTLAAKRIQLEEIDALQRINNDLHRSWLKKDHLGITLLNSEFHRMIYKAADNTLLTTYLDNLQSLSQRLAYICFTRSKSDYNMESHADSAIKGHQLLIDMFKAGNEAGAVQAITEHVKLFHRRVNHFTSPSLEGLDAMIPT